jgi:hypothetical protein
VLLQIYILFKICISCCERMDVSSSLSIFGFKGTTIGYGNLMPATNLGRVGYVYRSMLFWHAMSWAAFWNQQGVISNPSASVKESYRRRLLQRRSTKSETTLVGVFDLFLGPATGKFDLLAETKAMRPSCVCLGHWRSVVYSLI